jgi:Type I phosphodiesterase / nucleotide pyrophosphatase/PA14 domain/Chitobiase/beta-hexosaminidase C-terminal domain
MKREKFFVTYIFCLLSAGYAIAQTSKSDLYPTGIKHVIIVGCDGMSPNGIRTASTPVMHKLIAGGTVKWNVRTIYPSVSSPNWESMISGAGVEQHGVIDNDWERSDYTLPPVVQGKEGIFPTIFGQIRQHYPNAEIGAAYQWEGFGRLFEKKSVNFDRHYANEDETTKGFTTYVKEKKPLFGFMHLDLVDDAGHEYGHGSDEYYEAVHKADSLIGEVWKSIQQAGIAESTLFIITADHGGIGYGHGGATPEEMEIATIYYGKDVKKGYKIHHAVVTFDLAPTIAFALGFQPPYEWTGRANKTAFVGFPEPANQFAGAQIIPNPVILPGKHLYQQAGGLYFQPTVTVKINTIADNATTHYTLDGSEPDSNSTVYKGPFTINHSTVVKAASYDHEGNISIRSVAYFRLVDSTKGNGLRVQFYLGHNWNQLPLFSSLTQNTEWKSYEFALDRTQILALLPKDDPTFAAAFTGFLEIDQDGEYTFYNSSDDGSKLYIDGKLVVNNDGDHGVIAKSGSVQLSKGRHPIRMECYNGAGGFWLDAFYKGPGVPKQLIPADKLFLKEN